MCRLAFPLFHAAAGALALTAVVTAVITAGGTGPAAAQPAKFDPADFGKIVVAPRQSTENGITFEQAFGDYQNEPIITYGENSPAVKIGRPVGRLDLLHADGTTGFCTAFIVDEHHILTNHHCTPGMDGDPTGAVSGLSAAQFVTGYIQPGRATGVDRYTVSPTIVETNRTLDYTVLRVFGDPSTKYGRMELTADDPTDSDFLWIIGHPEGQSQHISREGCAAAAPAVSEEGKLVHTCDTLGGNSGSPVIRITDRRVIGLHHAGDNRTGYNFAIPMKRILEVSRVLKASAPMPGPVAVNRVAPPVSPPVAPPVQPEPDLTAVTPPRANPVTPVAPAPKLDTADQACTAIWNEAKTLGCPGYEEFVASCPGHNFAGLAQRYIQGRCRTLAAAPLPDTGPLRESRPTLGPSALDSAGEVLVVKASGGGQYRDLQSAVDAAPAGARIEVYPGTYTSGVDVAHEVEIIGVGRRDEIVLRVRDDNVIRWTAPGGRVSNLTIRQEGGDYAAVYFSGGSATLEDNDISSRGFAGVEIANDSDPIVRRNVIHDGNEAGVMVYGTGRGQVLENEIYGNTYAGMEIVDGGDPVVRGNEIHSNHQSGLFVHRDGRGRIQQNDVHSNGFAGLEIATGANPFVRENDFHDNSENGIIVSSEARGRIEDNSMRHNTFAGLQVRQGADPEVVRNDISDNVESGVFIYDGGLGRLENNTILDNGKAGIEATGGAHPIVRDNKVSGNTYQAVWLYENGGGTYENNDFRGNAMGAFLAEQPQGEVIRSGNRE
jgi:parallel beta-helix repeat protein